MDKWNSKNQECRQSLTSMGDKGKHITASVFSHFFCLFVSFLISFAFPWHLKKKYSMFYLIIKNRQNEQHWGTSGISLPHSNKIFIISISLGLYASCFALLLILTAFLILDVVLLFCELKAFEEPFVLSKVLSVYVCAPPQCSQ